MMKHTTQVRSHRRLRECFVAVSGRGSRGKSHRFWLGSSGSALQKASKVDAQEQAGAE